MIEFDEVGVRIGQVWLLEPVSARMGQGRATAVRGGNGAGKTTLLSVLLGRLAPTTGSVRVAGTEIDERDAGFRRTVAGMLHHPPPARDMTIAEHATLVAATWTGDVDEARRAADAVLEELDVTALADRFPHELSTGQRQLAALALVLVRPAEVLVLDEPEQRLDEYRLGLLAEALRRRRDDGTTLVFATHSDRLADAVADDVLTLENSA